MEFFCRGHRVFCIIEQSYEQQVRKSRRGGGGVRGHILFEKVVSLNNLFSAWREFKRGKGSKRDVAEFDYNLEDNIFVLHEELKSRQYRHDGYSAFYVRDPKLRHIHKATVRDRLAHQAVFRVLYNLFDKQFIHDSYSCRFAKGTRRGVIQLARFARRASFNYRSTVYVLKCDVKRFFASINQDVLLDLIQRKVSDPDMEWLLRQIIGSFQVGLPLGNVTSQLFANIYLNELDQFIKHQLREKYYIRYCDDFVILGRDKKHLEAILLVVEKFLKEKLHLMLHPDKVILRKLSTGIDFLGYVTLPHYVVLRTKTKKRMMRKVYAKHIEFLDERIDSISFLSTVQSYEGILTHCRGRSIKQDLSTIVRLVLG